MTRISPVYQRAPLVKAANHRGWSRPSPCPQLTVTDVAHQQAFGGHRAAFAIVPLATRIAAQGLRTHEAPAMSRLSSTHRCRQVDFSDGELRGRRLRPDLAGQAAQPTAAAIKRGSTSCSAFSSANGSLSCVTGFRPALFRLTPQTILDQPPRPAPPANGAQRRSVCGRYDRTDRRRESCRCGGIPFGDERDDTIIDDLRQGWRRSCPVAPSKSRLHAFAAWSHSAASTVGSADAR